MAKLIPPVWDRTQNSELKTQDYYREQYGKGWATINATHYQLSKTMKQLSLGYLWSFVIDMKILWIV